MNFVDAVFEGGGHALVAVDGVVGGEALDDVGGASRSRGGGRRALRG